VEFTARETLVRSEVRRIQKVAGSSFKQFQITPDSAFNPNGAIAGMILNDCLELP
jgi:hypothetical protein